MNAVATLLLSIVPFPAVQNPSFPTVLPVNKPASLAPVVRREVLHLRFSLARWPLRHDLGALATSGERHWLPIVGNDVRPLCFCF
jgi:hypothetical protein